MRRRILTNTFQRDAYSNSTAFEIRLSLLISWNTICNLPQRVRYWRGGGPPHIRNNFYSF